MKKGIYNLLVIMAILLVAGCSKDATDDAGTSNTQEPDAQLHVVGTTRAVLGESTWNDIHAYLTNGITLMAEGGFKYNSTTEEWSTQLKLKSGASTYHLYGFMPDESSLTASLQNVNAAGAEIILECTTGGNSFGPHICYAWHVLIRLLQLPSELYQSVSRPPHEQTGFQYED